METRLPIPHICPKVWVLDRFDGETLRWMVSQLETLSLSPVPSPPRAFYGRLIDSPKGVFVFAGDGGGGRSRKKFPNIFLPYVDLSTV